MTTKGQRLTTKRQTFRIFSGLLRYARNDDGEATLLATFHVTRLVIARQLVFEAIQTFCSQIFRSEKFREEINLIAISELSSLFINEQQAERVRQLGCANGGIPSYAQLNSGLLRSQ